MVSLKPKKGKLLIAQPTILNDSSFKRSIVLLTEHSDQSSVGFILNKPLNYVLNDIIPDLDCDYTIYQGGPVEQNNLYFMHRIPDLLQNSTHVANGIYWGGNFEQLKELLSKNLIEQEQIRFFLGYSGWGEQQLVNEIDTNSWFISENDYDNIFSVNEESIWKNKLLQKGGKYKIWANAPDDIQMN